MDLTKPEFDVASAVERGAVLHLKHPFTDELMMDGQNPVTITLRGAESATVRNVIKIQNQKKTRGVKLTEDEVGLEIIIAAIIDWSHIGDKKGDMEPTRDNIKEILLRLDWIGQQILPFVMERRNFFTG